MAQLGVYEPPIATKDHRKHKSGLRRKGRRGAEPMARAMMPTHPTNLKPFEKQHQGVRID